MGTKERCWLGTNLEMKGKGGPQGISPAETAAPREGSGKREAAGQTLSPAFLVQWAVCALLATQQAEHGATEAE